MKASASRLLAAALAAACSLAIAQDKVVYGTASRPGIANASMFLTDSMGFFRDEGISMSTVQFEGTAVLLPQIANKSITIGYPIPDFVIISNDAGRDPLPLRFFYNVTRVYNWEIVVPADSPIRELRDLKGKIIGVNNLSTGSVPVTRSMLKEVGLQVGRDVELVATPQGAAAINALKTGRVQALNLFDVFHSEIEAYHGIPLRRVPMPSRYLQMSGNSFAAHVDFFRDNPDLLKRWGRAYSKGMTACYLNMEGCVRNLWRVHPSTKPAGDEASNMAAAVKILRANLERKMPEGWPKNRDFGLFPHVGWETNLEILVGEGTVKSKSIDLKRLYTNEFVPDFQKFNLDEVATRAKKIP
jgi:NitT/TauT family transport system substrate-binding protein